MNAWVEEAIVDKRMTIKVLKEEIETMKMDQKDNTAKIAVYHDKIGKNKEDMKGLKVVKDGDVNHKEKIRALVCKSLTYKRILVHQDNYKFLHSTKKFKFSEERDEWKRLKVTETASFITTLVSKNTEE